MTDPQGKNNPFTVHTPEKMEAKDTVDLFVDVFTEFPKIPQVGHTFLHGPRGSGKSMMFRYLQPDCQIIVRECSPAEILFWGVYIPIKNTALSLTELLRLENRHASSLINEHFLVMYFTEKVFASFLKVDLGTWEKEAVPQVKDFIKEVFIRLLSACGDNAPNIPIDDCQCINECFGRVKSATEERYMQVITYLKRLTFAPTQEALPYDGALCGYHDFLYPLLLKMQELPFMPKGPIYLLVDDADNLNLTQTRILNTWVSSRTSTDVSIKASTQLQYKTYRTITGQIIESPHDFSEVNMSAIYTASPKARYRDRIQTMVSKRLILKGINVTPEEFFPEDEEQENRIKAIAGQYRADWEKSGRGYRPNDDAYRYARPDYIKSLGGSSKSTSTYKYAGLDQLTHISSGVVRNFLHAAALMFGDTVAQSSQESVVFIPPRIQDAVVRRLADDLVFSGLEQILDDKAEEAPPPEDVKKLQNLIRVLGATFQAILLSDRSERRVFSIAISGHLDEDVRRILRLGSELGYLHISSIGNKEGTGRTRLYVLTRRLAPHFNLDPSSFAGYLFVTSDALKTAMERPDYLLRKPGYLESLGEVRQLRLELDNEPEND